MENPSDLDERPERFLPREALPELEPLSFLAFKLGSIDPTSGAFVIEWCSAALTPAISNGGSLTFERMGVMRLQAWGLEPHLLHDIPDSVIEDGIADEDQPDQTRPGEPPTCGGEVDIRVARLQCLIVDDPSSQRHSVILILTHRASFYHQGFRWRNRRSEIAEGEGSHASFTSSCIWIRFQSAEDVETLVDAVARLHGPRATHLTKPLEVSLDRVFSDDLLDPYRSWLATRPLNVAFQCEALLHALVINVVDMLDHLCPAIDAILDSPSLDALELRAERVVRCLRQLKHELLSQRTIRLRKWRSMRSLDSLRHPFLPELPERFEKLYQSTMAIRTLRSEPKTLRCTITPAGMDLTGPDLEDQNRVLRLFYSHRPTDNRPPLKEPVFMRLRFADEDGDRLGGIDGADIIEGKFKRTLIDGLDLAGRSWEFLGYSMSSLREHSFWFVAPFERGDHQFDANDIRKLLGDFSALTFYPARLAARISQCFSSTSSAIPLTDTELREIPDVERNGSVFSDGVATISLDLSRFLTDEHFKQSRSERPANLETFSAIQMRMSGAKGVLSLDPRLEGRVLTYRPSQVKFRSSSSQIEIARAFTKPVPARLNRPHIQLLDHLGVPVDAMLNLQNQAVASSRRALESITLASAFVAANNLGTAFRIGMTLQDLQTVLHLSMADIRDPIFRRALQGGMATTVRQIKFHGRIPIPGSWTLVGVMDEFAVLEPDEIYACVWEGDQKEPTFLQGTVVVSRSPTLHPGDVQYAKAIGEPPLGSPLRYLVNCVVFSQKGDRSLPSCLAGGDLDGDEFVLCMDPTLHPPFTQGPAAAGSTELFNLGRPATLEDIANFICDYMSSSDLGKVAKYHMRIADISPKKHDDPDCLELADLFSQLVDFPKTGARPPRLAGVVKRVKQRLDMATGRCLPDFLMSEAELLARKGTKTGYYESKNALGILFRAVDLGDCKGPLKYTDDSLVAFEEAPAPLKQTPRLRRKKTESDSGPWDVLIAVIEDRLDELSIEYRPDVDRRARIEQHYESYLQDLRTAVHTHSLFPGSNLLEEEALMNTCFAVAGGHRRRHAVSEALTTTLATLNRSVRRYFETQSIEHRKQLIHAFDALKLGTERSHQEEWGASAYSWIVLSSVLEGLMRVAPRFEYD